MRKILEKEFKEIILNYDFNELRNKSIMVTGATGLIASYLIEFVMELNEINDTNISICAIVRNLKAAQNRFKDYSGNPHLTIIEQGIEEEFVLNYSPNFILHAASNANPKSFDEDPLGTIKSNVIGTINLLDYAKRKKVEKFIFLSSTEIYGENISNIDMFKETDMGVVDPLQPRSCYTEGKRMAENICVNYYKQFGVKTVIARIGYAYGPTYKNTDDRVIPQFIKNGLRGEDILMKSNGSLVRSYIYLPDVISALLVLITKGKSGEAYNVANRKSNVSIKEIADNVAANCGVKVKYDFNVDSAGYSPFSKGLIDPEKIENLGWSPLFTIEEGIANIVSAKIKNNQSN